MHTLLLMVAMCAGQALAANAAPVDRTFSQKGDVIGDGRMETLTLHVIGQSLESPFKWDFTIVDEAGKVMFRVERNDASLDGFFKDDGYVANCTGYQRCKSKYYFDDLPQAIFASVKPSPKAWSFDGYTLSNLRNTATPFLAAHGFSPDAIEKTLTQMKEILSKPGYRLVAAPLSPVQSDPPMLWVPSIQMFVPIYQD
ncbi:hypothetical protein [Dyella sp. ASV21]|uniref:hypothetical protein n=1 Tax=Dyella sp. ASV21 TaxID=2795114 RepID=UPI0018EB4E5F|nr:hypothetical protein [Dyella sp. ASV21]